MKTGDQTTTELELLCSKRRLLEKHRAVVVLLVFVGLYRVFLSTSGHLYWPDEKRHIHAVHAVNHLSQGNLERGTTHVFKAFGRPGFVLISMVPAAGQIFLERTHLVAPDNPHIHDVYALFNVAFSLAVCLLFYGIALLLTGKLRMALLATFVYALLCNTNLYIRHLVPYDQSIFFFLFALYVVLRAEKRGGVTPHVAILAGLLSAAGFATYPGYYFFVVGIAVAVAAVKARQRWRNLAIHLAAAGSVLLVLEAASRAVGRSYIGNVLTLSDTITQGSFEEGFVFLFRYRAQVEGLIGLLLIALLRAFLVSVWRRQSRVPAWLFGAIIAGYLIHAARGVFFQEIVFYGRLLHMYLPFVVLASVLTIAAVKSPRWRAVLATVVVGFSVLSFASNGIAYAVVEYPRDYAWQHLKEKPAEWIENHDEYKPAKSLLINPPRVLTVNMQNLCPVPRDHVPFVAPPQMNLVDAAPHPHNFIAYMFEGATIPLRAEVRRRAYQMQIYERTNTTRTAGLD